MTMDSAFYDGAHWDNFQWDYVYDYITVSWTDGKDPWTGNVYVYDPFWVNWTSKDDSWTGSVKVINKILMDFYDGLDLWNIKIRMSPPDISQWNENADIWTAKVFITLYPPIYSAGGGWWIHVWGERLPNWKERRKNLENAYASWRYKITGAWTSQDSTWRGGVELASVSEERLQQQVKLMFGSWQPVDEDEDILWLM
jgi:hypothetical protein